MADKKLVMVVVEDQRGIPPIMKHLVLSSVQLVPGKEDITR